jgi:hypothetical protein
MKKITKFLILIIALISCVFLNAQDTLEEIVTWELEEEAQFRCQNLNSDGSDLNNDGYDDFIHFSYDYDTGERKFQFYFGSSNPGTEPDLEISTDLPVNFEPSWGGDLNADGYKDIVFSKCTDAFDPGDIYICFGGDEIDLEPELILQGEDYIPDPTGLNYKGFNGGYDFNGDGYDDLLTYGEGPSLWWNGLIQIFLGGEELSTTPDFQIQGNVEEEFGRYRAVGDINGDGYDDLIVSRNETMSGPVSFEIYLGGTEFDSICDYAISEIWYGIFDCIANGDFNGDNTNELLITGSINEIDGIIGIYYINSSNELIFHQNDLTPNGGFSYANINNDIYDDLVATYSYNTIGYLNIYLGNQNLDYNCNLSYQYGTFNNQYNKIGCSIGDINNDGKDEILQNNGQPYNIANVYGLDSGSNVDNYKLEIINYELQNYPNPFNPVTTISYDLPDNTTNPVIEIFNIKGEKIRQYSIFNFQSSIVWDGTDNYQNQVSSGIYLYRLKSDEGVLLSKKMLLLK